MLSHGVDRGDGPSGNGVPPRGMDFEAAELIRPGSRVVFAAAFAVTQPHGFGLQLGLSDGSAVHVLPAPDEADEVGEAEDKSLLELADWELLSPSGQLSAGPGTGWTFKPSRAMG